MKVTRTTNTIIIEQKTAETPQNNPQRKSDLKNIIELTQQYDSNPNGDLQTTQNQAFIEQQSSKTTFGRFRKYFSCLTNLWRYICYPYDRFQINVDDTNFAKVISRLKNKRNYLRPILPPQKEPKKVLVLDLDETLIHTTFNKPQYYDFESEVTFSVSQVMFNGTVTKIYTMKRFGLQAFLFQMSKLYEIIVFTASQKLYADKIINQIDPKKRISHRLYRQHCIVLNKSSYLKNLNLLGRNLKETIIVDDNNIAGILQPQNFYRIQPFEGNQKDRHLCRLSAFLKHIHQKSQMLPIKNQRKIFQEMEIKVQEQVIGQVKSSHKVEARSLNQRKRQYKHKKTNSEVESLVSNNSETCTEAQTTASELIKKL